MASLTLNTFYFFIHDYHLPTTQCLHQWAPHWLPSLPWPKQVLAELWCPLALSWSIPVVLFLGCLTSSHLLQIHSPPCCLHEFPFVHPLRPLKRSHLHSNVKLSKLLHCWKIFTCFLSWKIKVKFLLVLLVFALYI